MHIEIQKNEDYTFEWKFYDQSIQEIPSVATVTIVDNGGSEKVSAVSVGIATDGTMTYTLPAAEIPDVAKNFQARLTFTVDGTEKRDVILFDVVNYPLTNNVRDEDLFLYLGILRDDVFGKDVQTSSVGTVNTFVSDKLKSDRRDFKGGFADIYIDDTTVHQGLITGYVKSTGTATFTPAYGSAIPSGITVRLRTSYQTQIDRAYEDHVYRDIRNSVRGHIAANYIDGNILKNMTVFKALGIICGGKIEEEDDKWDIHVKRFVELYQSEYGKMNEPRDIDEDGNISETEDAERPNFNEIDIIR
jgi:hypothetical protein